MHIIVWWVISLNKYHVALSLYCLKVIGESNQFSWVEFSWRTRGDDAMQSREEDGANSFFNFFILPSFLLINPKAKIIAEWKQERDPDPMISSLIFFISLLCGLFYEKY